MPTVAAHYISKKMAPYCSRFKIGFQKYQDEEEKTIRSNFIVVAASEGTFVFVYAPSVSSNVVAVQLRFNNAHFVLANLQTTVVQVEKMVFDDTQLLHSLENEEQVVASTRWSQMLT
nr:hypothetical protein Iba_chr05bCG6970 [Ipomoea batatas]